MTRWSSRGCFQRIAGDFISTITVFVANGKCAAESRRKNRLKKKKRCTRNSKYIKISAGKGT
jgi:hypothetical protein